jgi:hypothetical protein
MKKTVLKSELEEAFAKGLLAIQGHKAKRISISKAIDLVLTAMSEREVKIVHVRRA